MAPAPVKVLYHLHPDLDTLDLAGPLEILAQAKHASGDPVFSNTITSGSDYVSTGQKLVVQAHIPLKEAYATLSDYDILIIPGGKFSEVIAGNKEPIKLIQTFANLPKRKDGSVRILLSVCTGALFLAAAGVLDGLVATTHADCYQDIRQIAATKGKTQVVEVRFVVNPVNEEKGLRTVTSGGVSCGLDLCLWLVGEIAGKAAKAHAAYLVQYIYHEGLVL